MFFLILFLLTMILQTQQFAFPIADGYGKYTTGAGKSTLMNILSGVYTDYDGELLFNGQKVAFNNTTDARQVGILIVHQELQLVPYISIAENIFLGREPLNLPDLLIT